jgi:hypothetical protein
MRLKTALLLLLGIVVIAPLLAMLFVRWHMMASPAPKPDFIQFGRYMTALNLSHDPVAAKIRAQIADGPAALARERAAAQAEGIDLDPAHLQKPLPPADQNAATFYDRWNALRHKNPMALPMYAAPLGFRYAYTPTQLARVQAILNAHQDAMALLHQATDRAQCVRQEDWQHTGSLHLDDYAGLREGTRELNTESYLLAKQGRYAEAIADQARGFRIADHVASEPDLISNLVGIACEAITLSGMEGIMDIAGPNPVVASQVRQTISARHSHLSLKYALAGEAATTDQTFATLRTATPAALYATLASGTGGSGTPPPGPDPSARFSPDEQRFVSHLSDAAEAECLRHLRQMIAVTDAPRAVRLRYDADQARADASESADPVRRLSPVTSLTDILILDFGKTGEQNDQTTAREQMLMAGAEALEVKGRTGAFPAHLTGHYPDPFADGKPLGYRREGANGFVVYSVGPTGKFTGGLPGEHHWTPYQIAFRYPGPAQMTVPPDMLK